LCWVFQHSLIKVSDVTFGKTVICSKLAARRLESWKARKPEAMKFLSLQASELPSLPAILEDGALKPLLDTPAPFTYDALTRANPARS
jgi:hypothetical protein